MARRKEEKEALRRERERREAEARAAQQRKRLVGIGGAVAIAAVAVVLIVVLAAGGGNGGSGPGDGGDVFPDGGEISEQAEFEIEAAARAANCELKDSKGTGVLDHTTSLDERVDYKDNPPTNGRHYAIQADDGLYQEAPTDEELVHTLEHGRVIIWVKPGLPEDARKDIRALFDEDDFQLVVAPRRKMPYGVAATAWNREPEPGGTGRTLGCDSYNENVIDALRTFRDEHRSNGPEDVG
jgi:hypothetical protein